jgi:2-polyprenyl-3-methyl-5-hydroxy-6-metoxy-1,4-benzoquinol methylase
VCQSCAYEGSTLGNAINSSDENITLDETAREIALKSLRTENFRAIVETAVRIDGTARKSLLDVGCAHGWFLEQARSHFEVLGLEPDTQVGQKAAQRGLPVREGYFPEALRDDEKFDVIVFNDVIEHIPDIANAVDDCRRRLNAHGLLILNLPNSRGFFYRLAKVLAQVGLAGPFERMWQKGMPSPHVHYFDPHSLAAFVAPHGFTQRYMGELPSLRREGLLERLRFFKKANPVTTYVQFLILSCIIPMLRLFSSDIILMIFEKNATGQQVDDGARIAGTA